jgi:hypothetical protein
MKIKSILQPLQDSFEEYARAKEYIEAINKINNKFLIITLVTSIDVSAGYLLDSLENMWMMWNCISHMILCSAMFYHAAESHSKVIDLLE